jgi:hypothetical protein
LGAVGSFHRASAAAAARDVHQAGWSQSPCKGCAYKCELGAAQYVEVRTHIGDGPQLHVGTGAACVCWPRAWQVPGLLQRQAHQERERMLLSGSCRGTACQEPEQLQFLAPAQLQQQQRFACFNTCPAGAAVLRGSCCATCQVLHVVGVCLPVFNNPSCFPVQLKLPQSSNSSSNSNWHTSWQQAHALVPHALAAVEETRQCLDQL